MVAAVITSLLYNARPFSWSFMSFFSYFVAQPDKASTVSTNERPLTILFAKLFKIIPFYKRN